MTLTAQFSTRTKITCDLVILILVLVFIPFVFRGNAHLITGDQVVSICASLLFWMLSAKLSGLYQDLRETPFSIEWVSFVKTLLFYTMISTLAFFMLLKDYGFSRKEMVAQVGIIFFMLPIQKVVLRVLFKNMKVTNRLIRRVLIVGAGENGMDFYQQYVHKGNHGYALTGFLHEEKIASLNGSYLGKISDIDQVLAKYDTDDIVVTQSTDDTVLEKIVTVGEKEGKRVRIIPDYTRFGPRRIQVARLGSMPIISLRTLPLDNLDNRSLKRAFDIVFSCFVIVFVLSWLFPIIAFAIKLSSRGPVVFRQERWGLNNKPMVCFKFRSMVSTSSDTDVNGKYQQASKNDPRITKIGSFLRSTNLDELPQFFNVLIGNMSVVGPRPHPVPLNVQSKESVENYMMRHWVKPGITGWAQVNGYRGETRNPFLMKKRVEHDVWYLENWNFWLDLQIIAQTLVNMVKGDKNAF